MKTINKITSLFVLCLILGFPACTEQVEYTPAEVPGNAQIYFPSTLPSRIALSQDLNVTTYDIELRRIDKTDALTVSLEVGNENPDIFTIPTSVNFAANSEIAKITINYDPSKLNYDEYKSLSIAVSDESETSPYGNSAYVFTAGIPAPWKSLGMATYADRWLFDDDYEVEIQQHMIDPTRYRLVDPFTEALRVEGYPTKGNQSPYLEFQILPRGSDYKGVTTTVEGLVVYNDFNTGYYLSNYDDEMMGLHPSRFSSYATENFWLKNIVKQFSADGKPEIVQLAPAYYMLKYGAGWASQSQNDGNVTIIFPGVVLADYSASIEYTGRFTDIAGANYAQAEVTLGGDVEYAIVALVSGTITNAALNGIVDGSIEGVKITENGSVKIPCSTSGTYTYIVITFADDDAKEFDYDTFSFSTGALSITLDDYCGNYVLTGGPIFQGQSNGRMDVTISKGSASNTLIIKGIDFAESVVANFNPGNGNITIAPQVLDDFVDGDDVYYMEFLTFANGNYSETALLTFSLSSDGKVELTPSSVATGYMLWGENYDDEEDYGWFDGYRNLVFTPQSSSSSSASVMKSAASKVPTMKIKEKDLRKVSIVKESKISKVNSDSNIKSGSVKKALRNLNQPTPFI